MTDISVHKTHSGLHIAEPKILQAIRRMLSTTGLILKDCRSGLLGTGIPVSKAFEMIYVEPYQSSASTDPTKPECSQLQRNRHGS